MNGQELEQLRQQLLQRQDELMQVSATAEDAAATVQLDQTRVGRLSRMDALQVQAMSQENQRRRQQELGRIASALRRINENEYGYCIDCGNDIALARLKFDPAATMCIDCANQSEH